MQWCGPEWVKPLVLALEADSTHPLAAGFRAAWPELAPPRACAHHARGGRRHRGDGGRPRAWSSARRAFVRRARTARRRDGLAARCRRSPRCSSRSTARSSRRRASAIRFAPTPRASVAALRARGWHVSVLSGDAAPVVAAIGRALGLPAGDCAGGQSPEDKLRADRVGEASRRGPVVMVGDGVNDAAAIAAASVGIGVHGGAEACLATADVYLTRPGPRTARGTGARRASARWA